MTRDESTVMIGAEQSATRMTREEIVAFFDRRQQAIDRLDAAALAADYAEDCIVESPTAGTHQGRAAVEKVLRAWFAAFLDLKVHSDSLLIDGNRVSQLVSTEGTDMGGFMGLPASGKSFRIFTVLLFEFKDRQIVHERRIYDFTGLLVQIGVLKAKTA